jgi:YD repeat-containing protein
MNPHGLFNTTTDPEKLCQTSADSHLGPASVISCDDDSGLALVEFTANGQSRRVWAEIALDRGIDIGPHDAVLAAVAGETQAYIIGVLRRGGASSAERSVVTRGGSRAAVVRSENAERIEVRNENDELLFEYDEAGRTTRVHVPRGNLDMIVPDGDVTIASNKAVRLRGRTIDMTATSGIRLLIHDFAARAMSAIGLTKRGMGVKGREVRIDAKQADLNVTKTALKGDRAEVNVGTSRTKAKRIETEAETITQRAGTISQTVTGLLQSSVGRVRSVIAGTWRCRAKRADLRTKDVFKVDGDRIHLG